MPRSTNKLPFFLLALTLLFSPLHGALAGLDFHASRSGQHDMHHTDMGATHMDAGQMMSGDCRHCSEQNGCNHHNCTHSHCASCIPPGLIGYFQSDLATRGTDLYPQVNQILLNHFTAHPYRPPKA